MNPKIQRLVNWCHNPEPVGALTEIVADLTVEDLAFTAMNFTGPPGRIAWAELGNRRGFADFEVKTVELKGQLSSVQYVAKAKAIHIEPLLDTLRRGSSGS